MNSVPNDIQPLNDLLPALREKLLALKLGRVAELVEDELVGLRGGTTSPEQALIRLLDAQLADISERRIERRLREAHLPERKTLAGFDFSFQANLDRRLILELATTRFIDQRQGIILAGNSGTGKSHLAIALAIEACKRGLSVYYTTAADMLADLYCSMADNSLELKLKRYLRPVLLVIDELGFDRLEQENARNAALFFKVVDGRNKRVSTIYTTNVDFEKLGYYLGDPVVTTAIVDRMVHRSTVITINGPSWRLKQSRELNARARGGKKVAPSSGTSEKTNNSKPQTKKQRPPRAE